MVARGFKGQVTDFKLYVIAYLLLICIYTVGLSEAGPWSANNIDKSILTTRTTHVKQGVVPLTPTVPISDLKLLQQRNSFAFTCARRAVIFSYPKTSKDSSLLRTNHIPNKPKVLAFVTFQSNTRDAFVDNLLKQFHNTNSVGGGIIAIELTTTNGSSGGGDMSENYGRSCKLKSTHVFTDNDFASIPTGTLLTTSGRGSSQGTGETSARAYKQNKDYSGEYSDHDRDTPLNGNYGYDDDDDYNDNYRTVFYGERSEQKQTKSSRNSDHYPNISSLTFAAHKYYVILNMLLQGFNLLIIDSSSILIQSDNLIKITEECLWDNNCDLMFLKENPVPYKTKETVLSPKGVLDITTELWFVKANEKTIRIVEMAYVHLTRTVARMTEANAIKISLFAFNNYYHYQHHQRTTTVHNAEKHVVIISKKMHVNDENYYDNDDDSAAEYADTQSDTKVAHYKLFPVNKYTTSFGILWTGISTDKLKSFVHEYDYLSLNWIQRSAEFKFSVFSLFGSLYQVSDLHTCAQVTIDTGDALGRFVASIMDFDVISQTKLIRMLTMACFRLAGLDIRTSKKFTIRLNIPMIQCGTSTGANDIVDEKNSAAATSSNISVIMWQNRKRGVAVWSKPSDKNEQYVWCSPEVLVDFDAVKQKFMAIVPPLVQHLIRFEVVTTAPLALYSSSSSSSSPKLQQQKSIYDDSATMNSSNHYYLPLNLTHSHFNLIVDADITAGSTESVRLNEAKLPLHITGEINRLITHMKRKGDYTCLIVPHDNTAQVLTNLLSTTLLSTINQLSAWVVFTSATRPPSAISVEAVTMLWADLWRQRTSGYNSVVGNMMEIPLLVHAWNAMNYMWRQLHNHEAPALIQARVCSKATVIVLVGNVSAEDYMYLCLERSKLSGANDENQQRKQQWRSREDPQMLLRSRYNYTNQYEQIFNSMDQRAKCVWIGRP
jgi:hypothetical protein